MISFFVPGAAAPGGSKTPFMYKSGKLGVRDAGKNNSSWKQDVKIFAHQALANHEWHGKLQDGPLEVDVIFTMTRPKSHYRTGKFAHELKPDAPHYHTSKPDGSKLFRATEDALTGVIWVDDALVALQHVAKIYGPIPGVQITIRQLVKR